MISDFGLTRFKRTQADASSGLTSEFGNSTYRAPECVVNQRVTRAADVWSLGCIFAEALTFAFKGKDGVREFMASRSNNYNPRRDLFHAGVGPGVKPEVVSWLTNLAQIGGTIAANFVDVLTLMLRANPSERPAIGAVVRRLQMLIAGERQQLQLPPILITPVMHETTDITSEGLAQVTAAPSTTEIISEDHGPLTSVRKEGNPSRSSGDKPNYEHSTTRTHPGFPDRSGPRTPQDSGSMLPNTNLLSPTVLYHHNRLSATRSPLRFLERYDTVCVPPLSEPRKLSATRA
jgi:serine/threonine protein kinase